MSFQAMVLTMALTFLVIATAAVIYDYFGTKAEKKRRERSFF